MDTTPTPPPQPAADLLVTLSAAPPTDPAVTAVLNEPPVKNNPFTWVLGHWQASLGALGVVAELPRAFGFGPPQLATAGHAIFLMLIAVGFISSASAKKVTDLENAMKTLNGQ